MPRRDRDIRQNRPPPRRGAGRARGGGDRGVGQRSRLRRLDPFDMSGRKQRGQRLWEQEDQPYRYDSNDRQVMIIKIVLALWAVVAIASAYADYRERAVIDKWADRDFITVPGERSVVGLIQFGVQQGIDCTEDEFGNLSQRCNDLFSFAGELGDAEDLGNIVFASFLFLFITLAIFISSFAYQANRNLLTLKSEGQRFSSVSAMVWLFVPLMNFYRGAQIFSEIWKGSDPKASTTRAEEWKERPSTWWVPAWWATFAAIVLFGPRMIRLLFGTSVVDDRLDLSWGLIITDLFMIVPAILAYLVITGIHERQESRHEIVGDHVAVPAEKDIKF